MPSLFFLCIKNLQGLQEKKTCIRFSVKTLMVQGGKVAKTEKIVHTTFLTFLVRCVVAAHS